MKTYVAKNNSRLAFWLNENKAHIMDIAAFTGCMYLVQLLTCNYKLHI